jgi:inositol-phosphate transport system substrate-binding protein
MSTTLIRGLSPPRSIILALLAASFLLGQYNTPVSGQLTAEERCGYKPGQFDKIVADKDAIEITVWARANGVHCWRAFLPVEAAKLVSDYKVVVRPRAWATGSDADADSILPAASKGEGPDIAYLGHETINKAYDLGYIEPLNACFDQYPEFDNVRENIVLWTPLTRDGKFLGVPIEPSLSGFFFSKNKLGQLGWSEAEIVQLPNKIRLGEFTLDEMADVALQAVEAGVVQPGLGYWPYFHRTSTFLSLYYAFGGAVPENASGPFHLSRAVLERVYTFQRQLFMDGISQSSFAGQAVGASYVGRNLYHDTVAHSEVLFWSSQLYQWLSEYAANYTEELGGIDYVSKNIGYALFPTGVRGEPASTRWANTEAYVILSERASGRQHQDSACALLAKVMTPEIYSRIVRSAGTLSVLKAQDDSIVHNTDRFASETLYFWDYVWQWPYPQDNPNSKHYLSVLDKYLAEVELGRLAPENAVDAAARELQKRLSNYVIIEP